MIQNSFKFIPEITTEIEQKLWRNGYKTWNDFLKLTYHPDLSQSAIEKLKKIIIVAQSALENENYIHFLKIMHKVYFWRLIPNLLGSILYIDVEATGLSVEDDEITSIATFDGKEYRVFTNGKNLLEIKNYIDEFDAICTFDGERLDLPLLRKIGVSIEHIHFDLFHISRQINLTGGLKQIEMRMGFNRGSLENIDGKCAIKLWAKYKETANQEYLDALTAYNIEDVRYLEQLLIAFFNELRKRSRMPTKRLPVNRNVLENPHVFENLKEIVNSVKD